MSYCDSVEQRVNTMATLLTRGALLAKCLMSLVSLFLRLVALIWVCVYRHQPCGSVRYVRYGDFIIDFLFCDKLVFLCVNMHLVFFFSFSFVSFPLPLIYFISYIFWFALCMSVFKYVLQRLARVCYIMWL